MHENREGGYLGLDGLCSNSLYYLLNHTIKQ
jgi:hypothetical protein